MRALLRRRTEPGLSLSLSPKGERGYAYIDAAGSIPKPHRDDEAIVIRAPRCGGRIERRRAAFGHVGVAVRAAHRRALRRRNAREERMIELLHVTVERERVRRRRILRHIEAALL